MKHYLCALLGSLTLAAATSSWAQDATILNARVAIGDGPVIQQGYIVVQQGHIVAVGPGQPIQVIGSVIDASGMTALPGLVDGHKHINSGPYEKEQMADLIENGFTTVLSGGGPADGNQALAQHIESGLINGPRVIPSARIFPLTSSPEQGRTIIRDMASQGIKFTGEMPVTPVPSATPGEVALLQAVVDEGKKAGVEIMVHAVSTPAMVAATQAGVRHQVHLPNKDFMGYADAAYIASTGTIVLDLISFGDPIIGVFQKDDVPRFRTGLRWPESIAGSNRDEAGRATGTEGAYTLINARRLWDASHGKGLGYGSDQSYAVHDVLEHELKSLMVMFSMQDVIRIMTLNTATFLNLQNEIGTLEPKKRADIVLVRGNPFHEFNDLLNTTVVLKDGKVVVDKRANRDASGAQDTGSASDSAMVGALTTATARPDQPPITSCPKLSGLRLTQARVQSARAVAATSVSVPASTAYDQQAYQMAVPARCEVEAPLRGVKGAAGQLHVWLPDHDWNASLLMLGGSSANATSVTGALAHGYAVASLGSGELPSADQALRGVERGTLPLHDAVLEAKALIAAYYGGAPRYSYWEHRAADVGPALVAVQAYPADFDGVAVGAPDGAPATTGATRDLSAFAARGGKIVEYHGGAAQAAPTGAVTDAYDAVAARNGGHEQIKGFYRLFLLPAGQKGDSYRASWIVALDEWVQRGRAPDVVLAEHAPPPNELPPPPRGVVFEPPFGVHAVCAYPMVTQTTGGPVAETPVDYLCVTASRAAEVAAAKR